MCAYVEIEHPIKIMHKLNFWGGVWGCCFFCLFFLGGDCMHYIAMLKICSVGIVGDFPHESRCSRVALPIALINTCS